MRWKIATLMLVVSGGILALTAAFGGYTLSRMDYMRATATDISDHDIEALMLIADIADAHGEMRLQRERAFSQHLLRRAGVAAADPLTAEASWRRARQQAASLLHRLAARSAEYEAIVFSAQRQEAWARLGDHTVGTRRLLGDVGREVEGQFGLMRADRFDDLMAAQPRLTYLRDGFDAQVQEAVAQVEQLAMLGQDATRTAHGEARASTLAALAVILVLGLASSLALRRTLMRRLRDFAAFARAIGAGDLTARADEGGGDELAGLAVQLNGMGTNLRGLVEQIGQALQQLRSAGAEIAASTRQQAATASEQGAAVQQTVTTLEEVRQSGAQIADNARRVAEAGSGATASADEGLQAVVDAVDAVDALRGQVQAMAAVVRSLSERMGSVDDIVDSVDDIAEQSHMVALNASVEAASAGSGAGTFTVVADEITALADRAREATERIRRLLAEARDSVQSSLTLSEQTLRGSEDSRARHDTAQAAIQSLAASVRDSVQTFQQTSAGVSQQQSGIDQVNQALKDIEAATAQNVAGTQQLEEAARHIEDLGHRLEQAVARFRT